MLNHYQSRLEGIGGGRERVAEAKWARPTVAEIVRLTNGPGNRA